MWKRATFGLLATWLATGCGAVEFGNGNTVTEDRPLDGFQSVTHEGSLDIFVREGEVMSVKVTVDSNLQDNVRTFMGPDSQLVIVTDGNIHPDGPARVEVTMPRIVGAALEGSGALTAEGFGGQAAEHVRLRMEGSGTVRFCGAAHRLEARLEGSGRMTLCTPTSVMAEAVELSLSGSGELNWKGSANNVQATSRGSGDMTLEGTARRLGARVEGSGDLDARALRTVDLDLVAEGSGDVQATVEGGVVTVSHDSSGDVELWGRASRDEIRQRGSGRVIWR
ncbi:head GIN domain-containing protein [Myxococcus stipitatus]|uniref:head GIN domain-containing protein n=1 Tax=Myxococcus stipitatus TaxID=83455 RepID=UPI0030CF8D54